MEVINFPSRAIRELDPLELVVVIEICRQPSPFDVNAAAKSIGSTRRKVIRVLMSLVKKQWVFYQRGKSSEVTIIKDTTKMSMGRIPTKVFQHRKLKGRPSLLKLYAYLYTVSVDGKASYRNISLRASTGISQRDVSRNVKILEKEGFIKTVDKNKWVYTVELLQGPARLRDILFK
nr:hypothetical protein BdHM001_35060 [Bdellovibrio sp. HM001]